MPVPYQSHAKMVLRIVLLGALFMATAGAGAYMALTWMIKSEDSVIVPDLVGKDVLVGLELLSDLNLNPRVKGTFYNDQVPKHHIIDQDPEPGSVVKQGRDVKIRVSRGPQSIILPDLYGLSLQQGRILLAENGLYQGAVAAMTSSTNPIGQIMAQSPSPGAAVVRDTCIDLLISRGPSSPAFAMVDLRGLSLDMAIRRLEQLQLTLGRIRRVHMGGVPLETLVDQAPPAGYRVTPASRVDLTVNQSPADGRTHATPANDSVEVFRYALENGFLKRRVQVKLNQPHITFSLFDDFLPPGQEIWLLIPKSGNPTVLVYVDDQLVESRMIGGG